MKIAILLSQRDILSAMEIREEGFFLLMKTTFSC